MLTAIAPASEKNATQSLADAYAQLIIQRSVRVRELKEMEGELLSHIFDLSLETVQRIMSAYSQQVAVEWEVSSPQLIAAMRSGDPQCSQILKSISEKLSRCHQSVLAVIDDAHAEIDRTRAARN